MSSRLTRLFLRHSVPLFLALILLGGGAISITTRFLMDNQQHVAMQKLVQIQTYFEIILEEMDSLNIMFSTNPEIVNRLKSIMESDSWSLQDTRDIRSIRNYISATTHARAHIDSIYIYQENSKKRALSSLSGLVTLELMDDTNWYESYNEQSPSIEMWAESRDMLPTSDRVEVKGFITIYRSIYNGSGKRTGVMVLNLLKQKLMTDNPGALLLGGERITISDRNHQTLLNIGSMMTKPIGRIVCFSLTSPRFGWIFDMDYPLKELYRLPIRLSILTAILSLVALGFGLFITFKTNQKERLFLQRTLELLEKAKGSKIDTYVGNKQENIFDFMTENILQTFLQQDYLKVRKEAMEYRVLQMQINPHFLFNTLETINWRAIKQLKGPNDVSHMISLMSKILKYSMNFNDDMNVTLKEEIRHSEYYLEIQKIRFPGQFEVKWDISSDLEAFQIPRLILQPLLENCFNHGFHTDQRLLQVQIHIFRSNGTIFLSVKDNGRGMEQNHSGNLVIEKEEPFRSKHIGLYNVQKRLYLFFKGNVEVHLNSQIGEGTEVLFLLPG